MISFMNILSLPIDIQIILIILLAFLLDLSLSMAIDILTLFFSTGIQDEVQILAAIDELTTRWKAIATMHILASCLLRITSFMDGVKNLAN